MEDPLAQPPQSQESEPDVVTSSEDVEPNVEDNNDILEPESSEVSHEDAVSSSTSPLDQVDAGKPTTDAKLVEEKPPSSGQLTSRLAVWLVNHNVNEKVIDLLYWRDVKKTAVVFGIKLLLLLFLAYHTLLSVVSFFALSVLTVSILYRIGMTVIGAVQKTGSQSPYKSLLEKNLEIPAEKAREIGEKVGARVNCAIAKFTKLFLVEDVFQSIKFGVFLWFLSCIGKWFSAVTLLIAATVVAFSVPKLYEDHQVQVDKFLCKFCKKTDEIVQKVKSKFESRFHKDKNA